MPVFFRHPGIILRVVLIIVTLSLLGIGCAAQYSAAQGNIHPWLIRQGAKLALFLPLMVVLPRLNPGIYYKYTEVFYISVLLFLSLVNIVGKAALGAARWLNLGFFSVQPSEIMKIGIILALSKYLASKREINLREFLISIIIVMLPATLVILQPNLGTATVMVFISFAIIFVAGLRLSYLLSLGSILVVLLPIFWGFWLHDYQKKRIVSFFNQGSDKLGSGYNLMQSQIAIGSGGLKGKGFVKGSQAQLNFLPEKHTDFVFTIIAEERGYLGSCIVLSLYLALILVCLIIGFKARDNRFHLLIAVGVSSFFFIHFAINIAMLSGLIPIVGVPLPLLSYGGSINLTAIILLSLVLMVSRSTNP